MLLGFGGFSWLAISFTEFFDAASRVNKLLFTRVKWVAHVADFDMCTLHGRTGSDYITAGTGKFYRFVLWMNV
jgi:hypothetical protein